MKKYLETDKDEPTKTIINPEYVKSLMEPGDNQAVLMHRAMQDYRGQVNPKIMLEIVKELFD